MRQAIQETMYLFRRPAGYANQVVISAHGGYPRNNATNFDVPAGVTLHFYSQHGSVSYDFGLRGFTGSATHIVETLTAGNQCVNYRVSKYQERGAGNGLWGIQGFRQSGRNARGENYASVEEAIRYTAELNTLRDQALAIDGPEKVAASGMPNPMANFDVVTIRNRWFSGDAAYSAARGMLDLETVITRVRGVHAYTVIHCFFCRSPY